jgi:hypothetical protein
MHTDIGGELINLSVPIDREAPTQPDFLLKESAERIGRSAVSSVRSKPPTKSWPMLKTTLTP